MNEFVDWETPFLFPWYHACFCDENPQKLLPPVLLIVVSQTRSNICYFGHSNPLLID